MRISRIQIDNFRNYRQLDVTLSEHVVIVGENKIGKSNLLHALRLVLDPSLPDSARQLRDEDFFDGLPRPLSKTDRIRIAVDLTDFEESEDHVAILGDHLVESDPMVARLTYLFQPREAAKGKKLTEANYEFIIYGGDRPETRVGYDVRSAIPLDVLPALRDAEGDLANWRRSPLRPLLDEASSQIDRDRLKRIAEGVSTATDAVAKTTEIKELANQISAQLKQMVGAAHAIETILGFSPTDPERLVRALRLFIDGGKRGINEASLGSANLLYLSLKSLELEQLVRQRERSHTFLGIEEPEAHLHPHVQRLVYREFLRPRSQQGGKAKEEGGSVNRTVILTTHSPHIVSVAPVRSLVLLRKTEDRASTEGVSTAKAGFDDTDEKDLERYLDVNRGEMLFAKGIVLVEGDAELFLLPVLAKLHGFDFDELGITVCSVSGTNFRPYVRFLGAKGLKMPFAVLTDGDPDGNALSAGQRRVLSLADEYFAEKELEKKTSAERLAMLRGRGAFVGEQTFEVDLFKSGRHKSMCATLIELSENKAAQARAEVWSKDPATLDPVQLLKDINAIGKGRFAQRLAVRIGKKIWPSYVSDAVEYVAKRCR
jgi:putative ATP-dependent endonuclease of OLD family